MAYLSMAALQLELGIEDNLSIIEQEIDLVKKRFPWVQMVVLPELCTFGPGTELAVSLPGEVENCFREAALNYDGGERYPHLERVEEHADMLTQILAPRTP